MINTQKDPDKKNSSILTPASLKQQEDWNQFWKKSTDVPSFYKYNLTICDNPKFIWFRNAKSATRTTLQTLKNSNIELSADSSFKCYYSPQLYMDYIKFAFVRNPWDRMVSGWINKVVDANALELSLEKHSLMQDFECFVNFWSKKDLKNCNHHFRLQSQLIDLNEVDFIGRFENFNEDLKRIFLLLGLEQIAIPKKNKSNRDPDYKKYYNERTRAMVSEMYQKDIQIFGYSF